MRDRNALILVLASLLSLPALAADDQPWLADRGPGLHTSLFGSYVEDEQLLLYAFYEYTKLDVFEYSPSEFGFPDPADYKGSGSETEFLLYGAYGFGEDLMVEFESAVHAKASLDKSPLDPSAMPAHLEDSGLGDTEMQVRWRTQHETADRYEWLWYFEAVFPLQDASSLVGTSDWELAGGLNLTKGHPWGTLMYKLSLKYDEVDGNIELGEFAVEYLKRTSERWRFVAAVEGEDDEISAIGEAQYSFRKGMTLKLNLGLGLTEKAPSVAPEVGLMCSF